MEKLLLKKSLLHVVISLESLNFKNLESKHIKNLYFVGEILDIDGITGGLIFNQLAD